MEEHTYDADVVEVRVSGAFSTQHEFWAGEQRLGKMTLKFGKLQGQFVGSQGERFEIDQPNLWKRHFRVMEDDETLGRAAPPKNFSPRLMVEFNGNVYECRPVGFWGRKWLLRDNLGEVLMVMEPRGAFKRGAFLSIYKPIPLGLMVFFYTVVHKRWQEQSAVTSSAGT
jgi:hypothetical protein